MTPSYWIFVNKKFIHCENAAASATISAPRQSFWLFRWTLGLFFGVNADFRRVPHTLAMFFDVSADGTRLFGSFAGR
ncbi:hypothetical protein [Paenibacillus sp. WC2504]|uniref:hypothetical protein n=1 Tax=Paenibacillus sp. WC2504 TaxID=3461403 RepID=UPI004045CB83